MTPTPASCLSWSEGHLTTCANHLPLRAHALGRGNLRPLGRYIYLIDWVSGQYGETLHECAEVFSRAEGEGKYCTRVQCLAILTTNPVNERFIIHFFDHWRLTTISQRTSELILSRAVTRVYHAASRSHRGVRRLSYSCIVYAKYCSHGSEKRLGWRASGNRSGTPQHGFSSHGHSVLSRGLC